MSSLPHPLPVDPLPLAAQWLDDACEHTGLRNPHAMALATATAEGRVSARMVLLKRLCVSEGFVVFFTNYASRKAHEIRANSRAAAVLYWEVLGRQLRFEGRLCRSPENESDEYFVTRPRASQINAWASRQSSALADDGDMDRRIEARNTEFAGLDSIPRPSFWGGYRLWLDGIELWHEGVDRYHERARYERSLTPRGDSGFGGEKWRHTLLQP